MNQKKAIILVMGVALLCGMHARGMEKAQKPEEKLQELDENINKFLTSKDLDLANKTAAQINKQEKQQEKLNFWYFLNDLNMTLLDMNEIAKTKNLREVEFLPDILKAVQNFETN